LVGQPRHEVANLSEAAQIWRQLAEAQIAQTNPAAYQEAALFLRKLRRVWARQGKEAAWRAYVSELRAANRRKRRLVETLDVLHPHGQPASQFVFFDSVGHPRVLPV
jgi:uncharacterized Zn finger protein